MILDCFNNSDDCDVKIGRIALYAAIFTLIGDLIALIAASLALQQLECDNKDNSNCKIKEEIFNLENQISRLKKKL